MQLNWLYFCGICQLIPLKLWSNTAQGCNHQSTCMPQLQSLCSAALVPNVLPRRDEGSGKPSGKPNMQICILSDQIASSDSIIIGYFFCYNPCKFIGYIKTWLLQFTLERTTKIFHKSPPSSSKFPCSCNLSVSQAIWLCFAIASQASLAASFFSYWI